MKEKIGEFEHLITLLIIGNDCSHWLPLKVFAAAGDQAGLSGDHMNRSDIRNSLISSLSVSI